MPIKILSWNVNALAPRRVRGYHEPHVIHGGILGGKF